MARRTLPPLVLALAASALFMLAGSVPDARAAQVTATDFTGRNGPLEQCPPSNPNCGFQIWLGSGKEPAVLLIRDLVPGQIVKFDTSGEVTWSGQGARSPCREGFGPVHTTPHLVAVGQFTDSAGRVVDPGVPTPNNRGAIYLRDFAAGITVPSGASQIWGAWSDDKYHDNFGICRISNVLVTGGPTPTPSPTPSPGPSPSPTPPAVGGPPSGPSPAPSSGSTPPDVTVTKIIDPHVVRPGGTFTNRITIRNPRENDISGVTVREELSPLVLVVRTEPAAAYDAARHTLTWRDVLVPAGSETVLTAILRVKGDAPDGSIIEITVKVNGPGVALSARDRTIVAVPKVAGVTTPTKPTPKPAPLAPKTGMPSALRTAAALLLASGGGLLVVRRGSRAHRR